MDPDTPPPPASPPILNYILGFLAVGLAWGFTTPFIRKGALHFNPTPRPHLDTTPGDSYPRIAYKKILGGLLKLGEILRHPGYGIPLLVNLTGSVWFFLLVGKAGESWRKYCRGVCCSRLTGLDVVELSLTVPITNSLAFLFTVLGEWWAEGKVIGRGESTDEFIPSNSISAKRRRRGC